MIDLASMIVFLKKVFSCFFNTYPCIGITLVCYLLTVSFLRCVGVQRINAGLPYSNKDDKKS